jgi:hypothetical protein
VIPRHSNCLGFETEDGVVSCAVDEVAVELVGDAVAGLSPEFLREASLGLLKYFREDLGRDQVTIGEFAEALATVLRGFGFQLDLQATLAGTGEAAAKPRPEELALDALVDPKDSSLEAGFLPRLRRELHRQLEGGPRLIRITGLRLCVKRLSGARRWNGRCQRLSDQIVNYLRLCFAEKPPRRDCAIVVL